MSLVGSPVHDRTLCGAVLQGWLRSPVEEEANRLTVSLSSRSVIQPSLPSATSASVSLPDPQLGCGWRSTSRCSRRASAK